MCGLVGVVRRAQASVPAAVVSGMAQLIAHRGPDDEGSFNAPGIGLHHRRLSIIDVAGGHQPMTEGGATLVFNGEIYNYVELRKELQALGQQFRTGSDTEVLLRGYLQWGEAVVPRLNGMFAFLLFDAGKRRLLAARDHFGVKPLYFCRLGDALLYASEIKSFLGWPGFRAERNEAALHDYVTLQHCLGEHTLFQGVYRLPPGHLQIVDADTLTTRSRPYWFVEYAPDAGRSEDDTVSQLRALMLDSARLQVRSDVPLGAYLSGGLDSSTVAALAAAHVGAGMPTFTGAFTEGREFDESEHAAALASHIGANSHLVHPSQQEFVDLLPLLAWHMDEPAAGPGLFPQFIVSREAARHVKVCLGGQGGDELFGGYARHLVAHLDLALRRAIESGERGPSEPVGADDLSLADIERGLAALGQYRPMIRRFFSQGLLAESPAARYFRLLDRTDDIDAVYAPDFVAGFDRNAVFERFKAVFDAPRTASHLDRVTAFDMVASLPALLQVEDRVSMAWSLESRVPLLDPRIASFLATVPARLKYRGGELKYLFKRAVAPWLPPSVAQRKDKMGFPVPLHLWARGRARQFFADTLQSRACRERGLFSAAAVERLIDQESAFGRTLWGLVQLELWHRSFVDPPPMWARTAAA